MPYRDDDNLLRPQVQDRWGRSPGNPNYNRPPQPGEEGLIDTRDPNASPYPESVPVGNDQIARELPPGANTWQHPGMAWNPATSMMAPRLLQENGGWTLTEHGNRRPLQPNEVQSAQGYVTDFWNQFPTGFQPGVGPQSNAEYGSAAFAPTNPTVGQFVRPLPSAGPRHPGGPGPLLGGGPGPLLGAAAGGLSRFFGGGGGQQDDRFRRLGPIGATGIGFNQGAYGQSKTIGDMTGFGRSGGLAFGYEQPNLVR